MKFNFFDDQFLLKTLKHKFCAYKLWFIFVAHPIIFSRLAINNDDM